MKRKMIWSLMSILLLLEVAHGRPLIRPANASEGVRLRRAQSTEQRQQLTLFPGESVEGRLRSHSLQLQSLKATRSTRHSSVLFPSEGSASDQNSLAAMKRATSAPKANSPVRRNLGAKRSEPQQSLIKSESLIECIGSGSTFCDEYPSEYTPEYVERLVKRDDRNYTHFFGDFPAGDSPDLVTGLTGQQTYTLEEKFPSCASKRSIVYPKFARDIDGDWSPVINTGKYRQAVQIDLCGSQLAKPARPNESSANEIINFGNLFRQLLPSGYRAKCTQRFQTYVLLTVSKGQIDKRVFKVPSHCEFEVVRHRFD